LGRKKKSSDFYWRGVQEKPEKKRGQKGKKLTRVR